MIVRKGACAAITSAETLPPGQSQRVLMPLQQLLAEKAAQHCRQYLCAQHTQLAQYPDPGHELRHASQEITAEGSLHARCRPLPTLQ